MSIHRNLLKNDLDYVKSEVDKLDIGKLEITPVDLSRPSTVVKNEALKETEYDELVRNSSIQTVDTINLVKKADYNTKIEELKKNTWP